MSSELYKEWKVAWNKDDLKFYDNKSFRTHYTDHEMQVKAGFFQQHATSSVEEALGCGPGSDLVGILDAVASVMKNKDSWIIERLDCICIGVDAFDWNQDDLRSMLKEKSYGDVFGTIKYKFIHQDMESFVHDRTTANGLINQEFDFICLSFADAGRNLELIGSALPQLLSKFGRILVMDNDIPSVRSLSEFGFTYAIAGYNSCMHTMGRAKHSVLSPFRPATSSPIREFRKAEKRERQRPALPTAGTETQQRTAYPDMTKSMSWFDGCSIL